MIMNGWRDLFILGQVRNVCTYVVWGSMFMIVTLRVQYVAG